MNINQASPVLPPGSKMPDFWLPDFRGTIIPGEQLFMGASSVLIIFMCNHSLFVKHIREVLIKLVCEYQVRGVKTAAINSNDIKKSPQDSPENMKREARIYNYPFHYLFDGTQEVARNFGVVYLPDFFVFSRGGKLIYHGSMDESRPGNNIPVTGNLLRNALNCALEGKEPEKSCHCATGCRVLWREGNIPFYVNASSEDQDGFCCDGCIETGK